MKSVIQKIRVIVYGLISQLPIFLNLWPLLVLPEILTSNFDIESANKRATIGGCYFTSYFIGIFIGSLFWPLIINCISKRNAILFAVSGQAVFNFIQGICGNLKMIILLRFLIGTLHNINTVGKSFSANFSDTKHMRYADTIRGAFRFSSMFLSPFLGFWIYRMTSGNFFLSCSIVSLGYFFIILLYLVFFYWLSEGVSRTTRFVYIDEEEEIALNKGESVKGKAETGLKDTFVFVIKTQLARNIIIVSVLSIACYKAVLVISVFFLEASIENEGLGISEKELTDLTILSYFPCLLIILCTTFIVPKKISYINFVKYYLILLAITIGLVPILKDISDMGGLISFKWFVYVIQFLLLIANPKIFLSFINLILDIMVDIKMQNSLRLIIYICSSLASAIIMALASALYAFSIETEGFNLFGRFKKHVPFYTLVLIILFCVYLIITIQKKVNEIHI